MLNGNGFRPWKSQSSWGVVSLLIPLLIQCGGQTELISIEQSSGGSTNASAGGSSGMPSPTSTGGSVSTSTGRSTGPCGQPSFPPVSMVSALDTCAMSASGCDNSCTVDSDCIGVPEGNPCISGCYCPTTAVNVGVGTNYLADFKDLNAGLSMTANCNCPCLPVAPCCRQGVCYNSCGMCSFPN
jgi:hypothetical protein